MYHRSLESLTAGLLLRQNDSAQGQAPARRCRKDCFSFCRALQFLFTILFVLATAAFVRLHLTFGGQAGCLRQLLHTTVCEDGGSQGFHVKNDDDILLVAASAAEALVNPSVRDTFGADLVVAAVVAPSVGPESNGLSAGQINTTIHSNNVSQLESACAGLLAKDAIVYVYFERDLPFAAAGSSSEALGTSFPNSSSLSQPQTSGTPRSNDVATGSAPQRSDELLRSPARTTFNRSLARYEWSQVSGILALPFETRADHNFTAYDVVCTMCCVPTCVCVGMCGHACRVGGCWCVYHCMSY